MYTIKLVVTNNDGHEIAAEEIASRRTLAKILFIFYEIMKMATRAFEQKESTE